jgi:hypothetical protein
VDAREPALFRVLAGLFVRRLVDNDLLSPHSDRHHSLAVLYALTLSAAIFVTFFLCVNYLAAFVQLPASAALSALSDRFLLIGASIAVAALAALMVWDALALEPRDAAVLGSLPLGTTTIALAKLASVLLFASVLTLSWNAVPSALYPALLTINVRGIGGLTLIRLIAGHVVTAALAGLLGFFAVLAVRGLLCVTLGEARFQRWSSTMQSALLTMVITALLIAPTVHSADVRAWLSGAAAPPPAATALWYVGQNETLAGHLLAETPIVPPPRSLITPAQRDANRRDRSAYRELLPRFAVFARRGRQSLLLVGLLALGTFAWTNRRLPERAGAPATSVFAAMLRLCERERSDPDTQAGFFFTIQTLSRSAPHRTILAAAVAVGLTHALLVLAPTDRTTVDPMWPDTGLLALSSVLLGSLAIAVRYAVTVPASGAASWSVRLAWQGDDRRYLSGVKRATTALSIVVVVLLAPLHLAWLGPRNALAHSVCALLFARALLELLFLRYRKLPFACGYEPIPNPKVTWTGGLAALAGASYACARVERWAAATPTRQAGVAVLLLAILVLLVVVDRRRRREPALIVFDEPPAPTVQRLGLWDHVTAPD